MDSELFSDKFRPVVPKQLIGASQIKHAETLIKSIEGGNPVKKILFMGPSGTGKTTISEMFVRHLLDLKPDQNVSDYLTRYNCTSETGIDGIRERILGRLNRRSLGQAYRIYFLDELHGLSKSAQNALLTPLEELPPHVIIIAATTEKKKIIETLQSRFMVCSLLPPTRDEFMTMAGWMSKKHKVDFNVEQINQIIDRSGTNVRYFVNFLQQVIEGSYSEEQADVENELFQHMFFKNTKDVGAMFRAAAVEDDYEGMCIRITRACITMLKKSGNNQRAIAALRIFGNGLSPYTDPASSFHKLLLDYIDVKT